MDPQTNLVKPGDHSTKEREVCHSRSSHASGSRDSEKSRKHRKRRRKHRESSHKDNSQNKGGGIRKRHRRRGSSSNDEDSSHSSSESSSPLSKSRRKRSRKHEKRRHRDKRKRSKNSKRRRMRREKDNPKAESDISGSARDSSCQAQHENQATKLNPTASRAQPEKVQTEKDTILHGDRKKPNITRTKPMTKEQYEAQQKQVKEVYDEESGRFRLVRGNGEIIERIVSQAEHTRINQAATKGDGAFFSRGVFNHAYQQR